MVLLAHVCVPGAEADAMLAAELWVVARVCEQAGLRGEGVAASVARGWLWLWPCFVGPPTGCRCLVWRPGLCLRHDGLSKRVWERSLWRCISRKRFLVAGSDSQIS